MLHCFLVLIAYNIFRWRMLQPPTQHLTTEANLSQLSSPAWRLKTELFWSPSVDDGKKVMVVRAWPATWCYKIRITTAGPALWQWFKTFYIWDKILGQNAKIVTQKERISSMAMGAILLPMGVFLLPLGVLGVPLGVLGTGMERQELLQEKVCYYQVLPWSLTFS